MMRASFSSELSFEISPYAVSLRRRSERTFVEMPEMWRSSASGRP